MTEERRPSANFIGFIFHLFNICTVTAPRSYTQELNKRLSAWLSKHSNLFTSSSSLYSVLTFKSFALTVHHFFPEISSTLDLQWILGHEGYTRPVLQIQGTGARICRLHLEEFGQPSSLSCDVISLEFGRSRENPKEEAQSKHPELSPQLHTLTTTFTHSLTLPACTADRKGDGVTAAWNVLNNASAAETVCPERSSDRCN